MLTDTGSSSVPLFPLNTVLFPGGPLPLRIFESRYIDMISRCMKTNSPFGVVLIKDGAEAGPATTHSVGTLARISDFYQGSDGLLGVTAEGGQRFRLKKYERQSDGLNIGEVELLAAEPPLSLPQQYEPLAKILDKVLMDLGRLYQSMPRHYSDAVWVSYRFAEVLPLKLQEKQQSLTSNDTLQRLQMIDSALEIVREPRA